MDGHIFFTLRIQQGFSCAVCLRRVGLKRDTCPLLTAPPESFILVSSVQLVTGRLTTCYMCVGNMQQKFLKLSNRCLLMRQVYTELAAVYTCITIICMRIYLPRDEGSGKGRKNFKPKTNCPSHFFAVLLSLSSKCALSELRVASTHSSFAGIQDVEL